MYLYCQHCAMYSDPFVIQAVGGTLGIRTTDGKLRGTGNIQKLSPWTEVEFLKMEVLSVTAYNNNNNNIRDKWVPVTTAWRIPQVADGGMAFNMEGSCEYIE